jgi:tetratricopeptide (TPR) repeat protein
MQQAVALDPKNGQHLWDLADTYDSTRQPRLAQENYEHAWEISRDPVELGEWALSVLRHDGDFDRAQKILERAPDPHAVALVSAWATLYEDQREYAKFLDLLRTVQTPYPMMQDWIATMAALCEGMQASKNAKPALESAAQKLEAVLKNQPSNYGYASVLGLVYAYLGRSDDAIRQAKLATDLVAKDVYAAPGTVESLAMVYAHTGHPDEALDLIEQLLTTKYDDPLTVTELRLQPFWDPLRDNPKFKDILKRSS